MPIKPIVNYSMYGKTARVFPFAPNWASPVNETLEWKTDVLRAYNGDEQRRQLRQLPRREFEYDIMVHGEQAAILESYLWAWQHKDFALPVWTDMVELTSDIASGALSCSVGNTSLLGFAQDHYAVIFGGPLDCEVVKLSSVSQNGLTFVTPTAYGWPAGTKVYPLMLGHLGTSVKTVRHTSSVMTLGGIRFQVNAGESFLNVPSIAAPLVYDGYEIFTTSPNWENTISNDFERDFETVDSGVGVVGYLPRNTKPRIVKPFSWLLKSRDQIHAFRGFAGRRMGQLKTCWMPSWNDDFILAADNSTDQTKLTVKGIWFADLVGVDLSRDRLMVTMPDGSLLFRRITAATPNYGSGVTVLQLDSTIGSTVGVGDNVRLRILSRCRLATDKIVIPWRSTSVATPQTSFTTVKT